MMMPLLLSAGVAIVVFIILLLILPQQINNANRRKREQLEQMSQESAQFNTRQDTGALLRERATAIPTTGIAGTLMRLPLATSTYELLLKAGYAQKRLMFLLGSLLLLIVLLFIFSRLQLSGFGLLIALGLAVFLPRKFLRSRIAKRNALFLNQFPDAIDMIVRSVRSGHPLNTALRMIAENMDNPIRDEFKQVVDEVSYGRTLPESLYRMAQRIGEQDLHFFVVMLSVQQETGGSLAEVLSNLSNVIRKRRQLRLKIQALTSEGRATSYILAGLPVLEFIALYFITPGYLDPLFSSVWGNLILGTAVGLILTAMWVVRRMIDIDI